MPRNVRNFWLEYSGDDGRRVATGPRRGQDGFRLTLLIRDNGGVSEHVARIEGQVLSDGTLRVLAHGPDGKNVTLLKGKR